jgi:hypothetical protein
MNHDTSPTANAPSIAEKNDATLKPGTRNAARPNARPLTTK